MRTLGKIVAMLSTIAVLTAAGVAGHINPTTMGFAYLLVVLFFSMWAGLPAAIAGSLIATTCYNFFFLPPLHTFRIDDPRNWVALTAFLVASLVVTRLVVVARVQAEDAERRRREEEALYALSVDLFTDTNRNRDPG